jgi:hypothetical protein
MTESPAPADQAASTAWVPVTAAAAVLAMAGAFFALMLRYTRGHLSPPLDDSIIYFQYAKQIAHGKIFVYIDGDPATSGSTSFLYPFILAAGYLSGFRDDRLVIFGFALATMLLAAATLLTFLLARRVLDDIPAWAAALLVAVNGWVAWTFFSLMESGLHAVSLLATLLLFALARESRRAFLALCGALALLPFIRPEMAALSVLIAVCWAASAMLERRRDGWLLQALPLLASVAGAAAYFGIVTALTGSPRTDTYVVQSVVGNPNTTLDTKLASVLENFSSHLTFAFDFFGPPPFSVVAVALAVAGAAVLVSADIAARRFTVRSLIPALAIAGMLSASLEQRADAHFHRWAAPYEPLVVILVVRGLASAMAWVPRGPAFRWPVGAALIGAAMIPTVRAASEYGQNTADIYFQQTAAARWLRETTPPGAIVGLNDAGAIPYYSRRRAYDIIGLVTQGNAEAFAAGPGSVYERIESLPEGERPTIYAIYPFGSGLYASDLGFLTPVRVFGLQRNTIAGSANKIIYTPDNSLLGAGDEPGERPAGVGDWRVVDRLDVADLESEDRHAYRLRQIEVGVSPIQVLRAGQYAGRGQRMIDGGRTNYGERFTLRAEPGKPFVVLMRTISGGAPVDVTGDGAAGRVELPSSGGWRDIVIARGAATDETIELDLRSADAASMFSSFSYWLLQPE